MRIPGYRWRRDAARPTAALLRNYLARAQAIADAGGGNLWVVEPSLTAAELPPVAEAVARHLAEQGVPTGEVAVLEGSTTARITVLAPPSGEIVVTDAAVSPTTPSVPR